jgi:hypothetical protein
VDPNFGGYFDRFADQFSLKTGAEIWRMSTPFFFNLYLLPLTEPYQINGLSGYPWFLLPHLSLIRLAISFPANSGYLTGR